MEDIGWIKLSRSLSDWEWYTDSHMVHLYIHLLIKASSKATKVRGVEVDKGELVTSLQRLSTETGLSIRCLRTCLDRLENDKLIDKQTTNKWQRIKICNYDSYKVFEPQSDKQTTDKSTGKRHAEKVENPTLDFGETPPPKPKDKDLLQEIKEFYNRQLLESGSRLPKLRSEITGQRKSMLLARIDEYGLDTVKEVLSKAANSKFLAGDNNRGFVASFEWIVRPNNFPKILDGNYDNRELNTSNNGSNQQRLTPKELAVGQMEQRRREELIKQGIDPDTFDQESAGASVF